MSICQGFSHLKNSYINVGVMSLRGTLGVDGSVDLKRRFYSQQRFRFFFFFSNGGSATCAQTPNFPTESTGDIIVCANLHANQRQHKWATDGFIWSFTFRAEFYAQMNAWRYTRENDLSLLIICPLGSWDWPNTVFIKPDMHEQAMILIWYLLRAPSTFGHAPTVCRSGAFCITCLVELNCEVYVWRWQHINISWCTIGNIKHSKP